MPFILIIVSVLGGADYVTHIEFASGPACQAAKVQLEKTLTTPPHLPTMLCVAKGAD